MKSLSRILGILVAFVIFDGRCQDVSPAGTKVIAEDPQTLRLRIIRGDIAAIQDVAQLPMEVAIPLFSRLVDFYDPRSERYKATVQALRASGNYARYFEKRLKEATADGKVDTQAFLILAAIDTDVSAAIIAPYLFDFTASDIGHGLIDVNLVVAANALGAMKILDAEEIRGESGSYHLDDFIAWQNWAIRRRFVPQEWKTRVGGELLRQLINGDQPPSDHSSGSK